MHFSFDLDGTLLDTRAAVRVAYSAVGVAMPEDAWGQPWREWLIDVCSGNEVLAYQLHRAKNAAYLALIKKSAMVEVLPPLRVLQELLSRHGAAQCSIITGASRSAARALMSEYGLPPFLLSGTGMTVQDKIEFLSAKSPRGVYVDDNAAAVAEVNRCMAPEWRAIPYIDQSAAVLLDQIEAISEVHDVTA